jgi:hypothetical protein
MSTLSKLVQVAENPVGSVVSLEYNAARYAIGTAEDIALGVLEGVAELALPEVVLGLVIVSAYEWYKRRPPATPSQTPK